MFNDISKEFIKDNWLLVIIVAILHIPLVIFGSLCVIIFTFTDSYLIYSIIQFILYEIWLSCLLGILAYMKLQIKQKFDKLNERIEKMEEKKNGS